MFKPLSMLLGLTLVLALGACSLPREAALQSEILNASDQGSAEDGTQNFAVHMVDQAFLPQVANWPHPGPARRWLSHKHGSNAGRIAAGDLVSVQIWDSSENSLVTAVGQNAVTMENIKVSPQGSIFLPYVGRVTIAGQTEESARNRIQTALERTVPLGQVILSVERGTKRAADLVGGVSKPGNYPIPDPHFTVLNLISLGGGVPEALRNPQVTLVRAGKTFTTSLERLYDQPKSDAIVQGGDKVIVQKDDRYFRALGATSGDALHYFETEHLTALDALAMIGGLEASRADPKGILVFREYAARHVKPGGPEHARTIFVIDLTSADGTFSAGKFRIAPQDTVLVTESPVNNARTIFGLIGSAFGLASTVNNS